jgi:hypothetical protein
MKIRPKKRRIKSQDEINMNAPISQEDFGKMVSEPQQTVSKLYRYGVLGPKGTAREWLVQYDRFMKGRIYQRQGWLGLARICGE